MKYIIRCAYVLIMLMAANASAQLVISDDFSFGSGARASISIGDTIVGVSPQTGTNPWSSYSGASGVFASGGRLERASSSTYFGAFIYEDLSQETRIVTLSAHVIQGSGDVGYNTSWYLGAHSDAPTKGYLQNETENVLGFRLLTSGANRGRIYWGVYNGTTAISTALSPSEDTDTATLSNWDASDVIRLSLQYNIDQECITASARNMTDNELIMMTSINTATDLTHTLKAFAFQTSGGPVGGTSAQLDSFSVAVIQNNIHDVTDYGAIPNDNLDDSAAFQAAIDAAIDPTGAQQEQANVHIPSGTFRIDHQIVADPSSYITANNGRPFSLMVSGDGRIWTFIDVYDGGTNAGFLKLNISNNAGHLLFAVQDMTINAQTANAGAAIQMRKNNLGASYPGRNFYARRVKILSGDSGKYFWRGIDLKNVCRPFCQTVEIQGASDVANQYSMDTGVFVEDCYTPTLLGCIVKYADYGVWYVKNEASNVEDGMIRNCTFDTVRVGAKLFLECDPNIWEEVGFRFMSNTVAFQEKGVWIEGLRQAQIGHNVFNCLDTSSASPAPCDIYFGRSSSIIVAQNTFNDSTSDPNRQAIFWGNDAIRNLARQNNFQNSGTAIACMADGSDDNLNFSAYNTFRSGITRYDDPNGAIMKLNE